MNKKILSVVIGSCLAIVGCGGGDESNSSNSKSNNSSFTGGWGLPDGATFNDVKPLLDDVDPVILKADANNGDGGYVRRSTNFSSNCDGNTAYWSNHFELGVGGDSVKVENVQNIAAMLEVSLKHIASKLDMLPEDLIRNAYGSNTADGRKRLGFCILPGKGSVGGGHGNEIVSYELHTHGVEYQYSIIKHELAHIVDSQLKSNEYGYNLGPFAWFIEGFAEHVSGSGYYNVSDWQKKHEELSPNTNIVKNDGALNGGYEAYTLYATMTYYLREQGLGDQAFLNFIKKDRWHDQGQTVITCNPHDLPSYGETTGACDIPQGADEVWIKHFEDAIAEGGGELTSYADFEENYYEYVTNWLSSK